MGLALENKHGKRGRKKEGDTLQVDPTIAVHKQPCNIITYDDAILHVDQIKVSLRERQRE
jgi:hypothetical protein